MRRRHILTATAVISITLFFYAQQQDVLPEALLFDGALKESGQHGASVKFPEDISAHAGKEEPSELDIDPPPVFPGGEAPQPEAPVPPSSGDLSGLTHVPDIPPPPQPPVPPAPLSPPGPPAPGSDTAQFQAASQFQQDLPLELPVDRLKHLSTHKPHNYSPSDGHKQSVYATFMATRNPSLKDPYYLAIHSLIYRILWAPRSRSVKHAFVVFVGDFVTQEQRQLLAGAGAIVRELSPLEWDPPGEGIQKRWKDLFAKLNMWKETEFERIVFLDADAFPVANVDDMFSLAPELPCLKDRLTPEDYLPDGTTTCEPYVFAGVPSNPGKKESIDINAGSIVFNPSDLMHKRLLQNYVRFDKYDVKMAEQAFLNWMFNVNGAFPGSPLDRIWGGFFPGKDEEGKLKVVHEKIWSDETEWLHREWVTGWVEMSQFYTGDEFVKMREGDGT